VVPELLELGSFGSLVNKPHFLRENLNGQWAYGITREKVPLQNFLHHHLPLSIVCGLKKKAWYYLDLGVATQPLEGEGLGGGISWSASNVAYKTDEEDIQWITVKVFWCVVRSLKGN